MTSRKNRTERMRNREPSLVLMSRSKHVLATALPPPFIFRTSIHFQTTQIHIIIYIFRVKSFPFHSLMHYSCAYFVCYCRARTFITRIKRCARCRRPSNWLVACNSCIRWECFFFLFILFMRIAYNVWARWLFLLVPLQYLHTRSIRVIYRIMKGFPICSLYAPFAAVAVCLWIWFLCVCVSVFELKTWRIQSGK